MVMLQAKIKEKPTNLLWSGGWDSTFQLLQILLLEKRQVQPYYLIDPGRRSLSIEIKTMNDIRNCLYKKYPFVKELLLSTQFMKVPDIEPDCEITKAFETLKKQTHIGSQYEWLARFCKQKVIMDMELSIEKGDFVCKVIAPLLKLIQSAPLSSYKTKPEFILFCYYKFPILHLNKLNTLEIVKAQNWTEVMNMTWFCHKPRRGIIRKAVPCGRCVPCKLLINEGFSWRLPLISRFYTISYRIDLKLRLLGKKVKNYLKKLK